MAVPTSTVSQAVDALLKWKNTQSNSHNPQLLPQDDFIYLILTLKKIPQKGGGVRTNPNKIPLPHPLISPTSISEICLIIDDRPNSKLTSEMAKKKIKAEGISVTKVIKLSKLKTNYKPFESKRKLCDSYEMFFADRRIIPLLPKLLGKQFFRKKKLPLPVDLSHKNWKEQIERGCSSGLLFFRTGTCSVIRVAKVSMERDEIVENVNAAINGGIDFVPKKLSGVRSLHLKFSESVALPLYQSLPDIKLKIEGIQEKHVEAVEEEVKKIEGVDKNKKKKRSNKGRIHEMNHDSDEDEGGEIENNDSISVELNAGEDGSNKKKRKGNVVEVRQKGRSKKGKIREVNHDSDEEEKQIDELGSDEVLNEAKSAKKSVKEKKRKVNVEENDANTKKGKIIEVNHESDEDEKQNKLGSDEVVNEAKSAKKSVKEKKRKGNVEQENDNNTKSSDKKAKKKGEKQNADSAKKGKKKGRSVSRV